MAPKIQKVTWQDIRKDFYKVNPHFGEIIDKVDPGKNLPIIKASFDFGDPILEDGRLVLLDSPEHQKTLQHLLDYSPVPLGIFLNKTCEAYVEINERLIPIFVLAAGNTIGLFETLNSINGVASKPSWHVRAGARSMFMLAKVNNALWHKRLMREFNITTPTPKLLTDQWQVFVDLANSEKADIDWHCEVLFFTRPWFERLTKDKSMGWTQFREYLYKKCWVISGDVLDRSFSFFWQYFSSSTMIRNYKPRIYMIDTIRHLISIGLGLAPSFTPAVDESCAPIHFLKKAYCHIYDLPHLPTMMVPTYAQPGGHSLYYSLGYPTLLEGHPEMNNIYNTISDLKEIKLLLENMQHFFKHKLPDQKKLISDINEIDFNYYHKTTDTNGEIKDSGSIVESDENFIGTDATTYKGKAFCSSSPFLNGCIQIHNHIPVVSPPKQQKTLVKDFDRRISRTYGKKNAA